MHSTPKDIKDMPNKVGRPSHEALRARAREEEGLRREHRAREAYCAERIRKGDPMTRLPDEDHYVRMEMSGKYKMRAINKPRET